MSNPFRSHSSKLSSLNIQYRLMSNSTNDSTSLDGLSYHTCPSIFADLTPSRQRRAQLIEHSFMSQIANTNGFRILASFPCGLANPTLQ